MAGLAVFALMIPIQIAGGSDDYPIIPPGLAVALAAGVSFAVVRTRGKREMSGTTAR